MKPQRVDGTQPVMSPPARMSVKHACAHCGRPNELVVEWAAALVLQQPERPSVQVVNGIVDNVLREAGVRT